MKSKTVIAVTLILLLAACKTNPISGRKQLVLVSEEQAQQASAQSYAQTLGTAKQKGNLDANPALTQRVKRITDRLIIQAGNMSPASRNWQWSVAVINEPTLNAWCMPGGKMVIYSGIIQTLNLTDDEIAQIMGHEISHALLGHGRERMSRAMATQAGLQLGSVLAGRDITGLSPVADIALTLPNSRESESEADRYGIELAARAGYDPHAAVRLWEKMSQASKGQPPQFLSTHPSPANRIQALNALVPQMMPLYEKAR
ncbi:MAG: M48 family metallopeptidase [Thiobacillaceae bacterium]|jgi:predicted Zn-dependent protease